MNNYKTQSGQAEIPFKHVIAFAEMVGVNHLPAIMIYLAGGATIVIYKDFKEYQKESDAYWCRN